MRPSFILCGLATVLGSGNYAHTAVAHSSLSDLPTAFTKRPNLHGSSALVSSIIPRGGASTVLTKRDLRRAPDRASLSTYHDSTSVTDDSAKSVTACLRGGISFGGDNIGWQISFILSLAYLLLFLLSVRPNAPKQCAYQPDGFCITNMRPGDICPEGNNSHYYAFVVDMILAVVSAISPILLKGRVNGGWKMAVGNTIAIGSHGYLHQVLDKSQCIAAEDDVGSVLYFLFTLFLSVFTFKGFSSIDSDVLIIGLSIAAAALTLGLSSKGGSVAPIFLITQLLASGVACLAPSKAEDSILTPLTGKLFVAPILVSIIELMACCGPNGPGLFNKIGGHVWYDVFLHIAILGSLLPKAEKKVASK